MKLNDIQRVYFIGIGGIGMSALARYFKVLEKEVAGYDKTKTPLTEEISALGVTITYEDSLDDFPESFRAKENTLIVYTPAVSMEHKQLKYFKENGYLVLKRSAVLGLITRDTYCFAVAGTHGKTTTSSILAHLLKETNTPFTAFLGGISEDFNSNFWFGGNTYSVVEADEYDRSFLQLVPDVACITSMDADHLDIYGTPSELKKAFVEFVGKIKPKGSLVVRNGLPLKGLTYGIEDNSDYCIRNLKIVDGVYVFDVETPNLTLKKVRFNKPGKHNLLNGLAAFSMALQIGSSPEELANALATFKGVRRRFSYQIKTEDFVFIDDYAHHPKEIEAVYEAISEMHPNKKNLVIFQPHLFTRTKDFGDEFARSLTRFNSILLLDIYPAREKPIEGITAKWLMDKIPNPSKKIIAKKEILNEIKSQNPEVLITLGAGDIGLEIKELSKNLAHEK
ncbi:UDP-N-acetylmuramate--L-alanine ligase [Eudoraea chungangensis]|uniref:UDP-N-acetylmuramate--L-alanine ligase n=1 Tax=Eudoraea chungangensis TaxID=1481905 RepID=UPI0023EDAAC2|nr:UDP-N-acetylmuramate--L-alanine ligase [Eudoraea chungangensis]